MSSRKKKKSIRTQEEYEVFYGIPHCHTSASTGKGTIKDAIEHSKINKLNYIIFTDHYMYLNKDDKVYKNKWEMQKEIITKYKKHHKRFLPILGFEYKFTPKLHINIINPCNCINKKISKDTFIQWFKNNGGIGIINHPGESVNIIKNNLELNKYLSCIEVGNGSFPNRYKRYYKHYFYLLDLGWKLAAVNGQDNHRDDWGDTDNVTAVLAKRLSTESIENAFKNRQTFSTESKTLKIIYKINGCYMGETIDINGSTPLNFSIFVEDKNYLIKGVKVFTNGGIVIKESLNLNDNKVELNFTIQGFSNNSWYVVNVLLEDSREAITSPIFVKSSN